MNIVLNSVLFYAVFASTDAMFLHKTGFLNNFMNDWNCRLRLIPQVDGSDSIVESYYNKSGDVCKSYCRVRKTNSLVVQYFTFNAPELSICGPLKLCRNGECRSCLWEKVNSFKNLFGKPTVRPLIPVPVSSNNTANDNFGPTIKTVDIKDNEIEREDEPILKPKNLKPAHVLKNPKIKGEPSTVTLNDLDYEDYDTNKDRTKSPRNKVGKPDQGNEFKESTPPLTHKQIVDKSAND